MFQCCAWLWRYTWGERGVNFETCWVVSEVVLKLYETADFTLGQIVAKFSGLFTGRRNGMGSGVRNYDGTGVFKLERGGMR